MIASQTGSSASIKQSKKNPGKNRRSSGVVATCRSRSASESATSARAKAYTAPELAQRRWSGKAVAAAPFATIIEQPLSPGELTAKVAESFETSRAALDQKAKLAAAAWILGKRFGPEQARAPLRPERPCARGGGRDTRETRGTREEWKVRNFVLFKN